MKTSTIDRQRASTLSRFTADGKTAGTTGGELTVRRLNVMRIGYAVMGVGIAATNWPLLFNRSEPWPLYEGVTTYMVVAIGLLALLGLRYPVKMLPILLFESAWKLLWLGAIAVPLWLGDGQFRGGGIPPLGSGCARRHPVALRGEAVRDQARRRLAFAGSHPGRPRALIPGLM